MNKFYILFFSLTFSLGVFAQDGVQERAKKIADEMTMVMSLDDVLSEKVYIIQLKRFIDAQRIRKTYSEDKEQMRLELKKLYNRLWGKLKGVLGDERMELWKEHKRNI
jgi:hypothetical protein|tara:strand:+ start:403 stop:726 length:324 start_codon:yes stop_codon:yes gene_type:complete